MISLMGRLTHFKIGCGIKLSSLRVKEFQITMPLLASLFTSLLIGAFIIVAEVGTLCGCPLIFLNLLISPLTLDILWISVPRKYAFSLAALVIRVFSRDNSNFSVSAKKSAILFLISLAISDDPAIPINQSSAYLT